MASKDRLVPLIESDTASQAVQEIYDDIRRVKQKEPGTLFKAWALSEDLLRVNWMATKVVMGEGVVHQHLKETVALYVAQLVGCEA
jgi:hypothetical protein